MTVSDPSLRKLPTESGLLLLDTSSNRLFAFNDGARQVWELLEQGRSSNEITADLAAHHGVSGDIVRKDVEAILREWRSQGILQANDPIQPTVKRPTIGGTIDWSRVPEPKWAAVSTCTIRNTVVTLAVEPVRLVAFVELFFRHLETPNAQTDVRLEVREAGGDETVLLVDGHERLRTRDGGQLLGAINQIILEHIHPGIEWLAIIHGAAVARNGAGIAFPAACGSGKTTLTAYLLPRGYDYLADDHVPLAAPGGRIVPWPMPLSIKAGSWNLLSETYKNLPNFPQYRTQRGDARQLVPPPEVWDTDPVPLRYIVFPRYLPGAETSLTRLTPFEALQRLLGDQIWLGCPMTEARVGAFLAWLDDKPAYVLENSDVAEAARCIGELL